jgi:hypothetical protein
MRLRLHNPSDDIPHLPFFLAFHILPPSSTSITCPGPTTPETKTAPNSRIIENSLLTRLRVAAFLLSLMATDSRVEGNPEYIIWSILEVWRRHER